MNKFQTRWAFGVLLTLFLTTPLLAQETAEPKKLDDPQWRSVVMVKFHSGKMGRAMEIIDEFQKVTAKAGTPAPELQVLMATGEWDMMVVWRMEGGIADMDWDTSPNNIKWRKAAIEHFGNEDEMKAIWAEYRSLIMESERDIARRR
ncbi:MAG: hypothetical protein IPM12_10905 [Flavobacteriales bacterium]|nr:hypothetical protein [Flavobacteriales bacterium]